MEQHKHILYGVLNWGLGHASRSIPVINAFLQKGFTLTIASDGLALNFLKERFPEVDFLPLTDPKIHYSAGSKQELKLAQQLLKLSAWYRNEQKIIANFLEVNSVDLIISDNRPSVKSKRIPSYYITHQLKVKSGLFNPFSTIGHEWLYKDYDAIWVPDVASNPNLSGDLSHKSKRKNVIFIGPLSDLKPVESTPIFDAAIILSGPEPQRSIFEAAAISQLAKSELKILLIRGTTKAAENNIPVSWQRIDLASRADVQNTFEKSKVIIARSGYSTIMDLYSFNKAAILVPTPGQPEQEYLATLPLHQHNFVIQNQNNLNLLEGFRQAEIAFENFKDVAFERNWDAFLKVLPLTA